MFRKEEATEAGKDAGQEKAVSEEKVRKIAIGATVGGVLLIVFLVIVLIIQFVQMGIRNAEKAELDRLIEQQKQQYDGEVADLDDLQNGFGMFWKALDYDYKYKG